MILFQPLWQDKGARMGVVFLVVAFSATLYVTDLRAGNTRQAMILRIINFFFLCTAFIWLARGVTAKV